MNIGPIFRRELIDFARRPGMRWLRVLAAALVIFACWRAVTENAWLLKGTGRPLFQGLNKLLFVVIWFLGPLMTADCLSREKRDGTIGLLFLTPLKPGEVVMGKVIVHALRGFSVIVAAFPILTLPILVGGVTLADGVRMLMFHLSALGLALTSGVLASALATRAAVARMLAFLFTALVGCLFGLMYVTVITISVWRSNAALATQTTYPKLWLGHLGVLLRTYGPEGAAYNPYGRWGFGGGATWTQVGYGALIAVGSALLVFAAGRFAAHCLQKTWRPKENLTRPSLVETLPALRTRGATDDRKLLVEYNPLRWLEVRDRTPLTWLFFGCATGLLTYGWMGLVPLSLAHALMALTFAIIAANALKKEKEDGRYELLAVTPLPMARWYWERYRQILLNALFAGGLMFAINYAGLLQVTTRTSQPDWARVGREGAVAGIGILIWLFATVSVAFAGAVRGRSLWFSVPLAIAVRHAGIDLMPLTFGFAFRALPGLDVLNFFLVPAAVLYVALRIIGKSLDGGSRP